MARTKKPSLQSKVKHHQETLRQVWACFEEFSNSGAAIDEALKVMTKREWWLPVEFNERD